MILARELPASIVIIGAGAIGLEFAYILRSYGVQVTVIEYFDRPLPNEDVDVSKEVRRQLRKLDVPILTSTRVRTVTDDGSQAHVTYTGPDGAEGAISADKALVAVGFAPNVAGFRPGTHRRRRRRPRRDRRRQRHAHEHAAHLRDRRRHREAAAGDVAEAQGLVAAETIAGAETMPIDDYRMMPRATYLQPQVASFGLTEQQARDAGHDVVVATFPWQRSAKAQALGGPLWVRQTHRRPNPPRTPRRPHGGHDVSELLPELTLAQKWDLTALELGRNVHTHPSLSESLQDAFHGLQGHFINI